MATTTMRSAQDLFLHELGDILYAERAIEKMLPTMAGEASDDKLRQGFEKHLEETRQQIRNLEQVFGSLGESPKAEKCPGIEGLKKEHDDFMQQHQPAPAVCDAFNVGAAARVEHYEIAAYRGLIAAATSMGNDDAVRLLRENLSQEERMLGEAEKLAPKLFKTANGG